MQRQKYERKVLTVKYPLAKREVRRGPETKTVTDTQKDKDLYAALQKQLHHVTVFRIVETQKYFC